LGDESQGLALRDGMGGRSIDCPVNRKTEALVVKGKNDQIHPR